MPQLPRISIVGRPNVGKSSLLNCLVGRRISIVKDEPGITRDRVSAPWFIKGHYVELVDTGGFGFEDADELTEAIHEQILNAMETSVVVILLVDATVGVLAGDLEVAALLRKLGSKVVLVANKADDPSKDGFLTEFTRMGFGTPLPISATCKRGVAELAERLSKLPEIASAPSDLGPDDLHVAIVGKRNAGKSTLINTVATWAGDPGQRVIVSEVAGTTRDSVDVRISVDDRNIVLIDTAGVRKKSRVVQDDLEYYAFHRAQRSLRRARAVVLLMDALDPVSEPDKKLADEILKHFKPVVLAFNKWDAILAQHPGEDEESLQKKFRKYIKERLPSLTFAPVIFISGQDTSAVGLLLKELQSIQAQTRARMGTGALNQLMEKVLAGNQPIAANGRRGKLFYATQIATEPPTVALVVNDPKLFPKEYLRYMTNRLRDQSPFPSVPIDMRLRGRSGHRPGDRFKANAPPFELDASRQPPEDDSVEE